MVRILLFVVASGFLLWSVFGDVASGYLRMKGGHAGELRIFLLGFTVFLGLAALMRLFGGKEDDLGRFWDHVGGDRFE